MNKISLTPEIINNLRQLKVAIVYLYGSQAEKTAHQLSDYDIGVVFSDRQALNKVKARPLQTGAEFDLLFEKALNQKNIQTTFLQTAPIALQKNAVTTGQVIFEENPDFRANYEEYVLSRYADFEPLLSQFYKDRLEVKYV